MNFEQVYEKYQNGTATPQERAYIEEEIEKAKKLNAIIDELDAKHVIESAEVEDIRKAKKVMKKKFGLQVLLICFSVLLALSLLTAGALSVYVHAKASGKADYTKEECIEFAKKLVNEHSDTVSTSFSVYDVERDLRFYDGKLSRATYIYEITVKRGSVEYEVEVNTATGETVIVDVDD